MAKPRRRVPDWYSIPVSTVRRGSLLILLATAFVGAAFGYRQWERYALRNEALRTIDEAGDLIRQMERREDFEQLREEHLAAWELLGKAREAYTEENYARSVEHGRRSLLVLHNILQIGERGGEATVRFLNVRGNVEYRRGDRGAWTRARSKVSLTGGDWVKTGTDGLAEIVFGDGTLYTLRQNTMVHLGGLRGSGPAKGGERVTDIRFGWVELNTSNLGSTVKTPSSEATVSRDSEALVSYDRERGRGRFAAFEGSVQVRSAGGETRQLGRLQEVEQVGEVLSETRELPPAPTLVAPPNDHELDFDSDKRVRLAWRPVARAARYALQVSHTRLFADNIVDVNNRSKTSATLGIRGEGSFVWQVAAIDSRGARGAWSEPRAFRVASMQGLERVDDETPPDLEVHEIQPYGSLVIVNGRAEPGSTVTVNGEQASPQLDGSFSKTVQMTQEGWGFVVVAATDAWGNTSETRERVFIDVF